MRREVYGGHWPWQAAVDKHVCCQASEICSKKNTTIERMDQAMPPMHPHTQHTLIIGGESESTHSLIRFSKRMMEWVSEGSISLYLCKHLQAYLPASAHT